MNDNLCFDCSYLLDENLIIEQVANDIPHEDHGTDFLAAIGHRCLFLKSYDNINSRCINVV